MTLSLARAPPSGSGKRNRTVYGPLCSGQATGRQWREIIAVDDVVGDPRVIGLLGKDLLQDCARLELARACLVSVIRRLIQRESVENRCLGVIWIAQVALLHRLLPCEAPRLVAPRLRVF